MLRSSSRARLIPLSPPPHPTPTHTTVLASVSLVKPGASSPSKITTESTQKLVWQLPISSTLVGNSALSVSQEKLSTGKKEKDKKKKKTVKNEDQKTQYIAPKLTFRQAGRIRAWHVHAKSGPGASAQMEVQVWRPVGFDKYVMIGSNTIFVEEGTFALARVPDEVQLHFQPGDCIGLRETKKNVVPTYSKKGALSGDEGERPIKGFLEAVNRTGEDTHTLLRSGATFPFAISAEVVFKTAAWEKSAFDAKQETKAITARKAFDLSKAWSTASLLSTCHFYGNGEEVGVICPADPLLTALNAKENASSRVALCVFSLRDGCLSEYRVLPKEEKW